MEDDPFQFFEIPFNDINEDNQGSLIVQENDSEDTLTQSNEDNEVGEREMEHHNIADELKKPSNNRLANIKKDSGKSDYSFPLQIWILSFGYSDTYLYITKLSMI